MKRYLIPKSHACTFFGDNMRSFSPISAGGVRRNLEDVAYLVDAHLLTTSLHQQGKIIPQDLVVSQSVKRGNILLNDVIHQIHQIIPARSQNIFWKPALAGRLGLQTLLPTRDYTDIVARQSNLYSDAPERQTMRLFYKQLRSSPSTVVFFGPKSDVCHCFGRETQIHWIPHR